MSFHIWSRENNQNGYLFFQFRIKMKKSFRKKKQSVCKVHQVLISCAFHLDTNNKTRCSFQRNVHGSLPNCISYMGALFQLIN